MAPPISEEAEPYEGVASGEAGTDADGPQRFDPEEQEITLGNIYDLYKEGYKYVLMSTQGNGDRIIELSPEKNDKSYHKIRLVIDKNDDLKKFTVFEKTGNQYIYDIKNFKSVALSDAYFTFDTSKYPDVEVIDFR